MHIGYTIIGPNWCFDKQFFSHPLVGIEASERIDLLLGLPCGCTAKACASTRCNTTREEQYPSLEKHVLVLVRSGGNTADKFIENHIDNIAVKQSDAADMLIPETSMCAHAQRNTH